jgi:hypothetical protein
MPTFQNDPVISISNSQGTPAVQGEGSGFEGVRGISHDEHGGVVGINDGSPSSPPGAGGNGGWFESTQGEGVRGWAKNPNHGGVVGVNTAGGIGVFGTSDNNVDVWGTSVNFEGIHAETRSSSTAAMSAYQMNAASGSAAFFVKHMGNRTAGRFEGDVEITGGPECAGYDHQSNARKVGGFGAPRKRIRTKTTTGRPAIHSSVNTTHSRWGEYRKPGNHWFWLSVC